jgi:ATP-dependent DNA helicase RecG
MTEKALNDLIKKGEGLQLEFKEASFALPQSVFQTVCAMLNRQGGHLLLGVSDSGEIVGVIESCVSQLKAAYVTSVNNSSQLNPKYYLNIHDIEVDGKIILHSYIPESSQVHSYLEKIYDRNGDGDFDISNSPDLIRQLHLKKQGSFSENTIYSAISIGDLRTDLIQRCRVLANNNKPGHAWSELDDAGMLRSANLWKKDWKTGEEGYTLAAALLLGKDEVIRQILPHYKTDAILRRQNLERYDDREIIQTNLIESYDRLMAFVAKHLPDKFFMEADQRVSLRDKLFREVIANCLIHREYINEYPARFIIDNNKVVSDNWNRPHGSGKLRLDSYTPFPKNPIIAAFFREIGRAEELGSGFRKCSHYTRLYTDGLSVEFVEGDVFRVEIPLRTDNDEIGPRISCGENEGVKGKNEGVKGKNEGVKGKNEGVKGKNEGVKGKNEGVKGGIERILDGVIVDSRTSVKIKMATLLYHIQLSEGKNTPEYAELAEMNVKSVERYIKQLREAGFIEFRGGSSKTGGYFITDKFKTIINSA